MGIHRATHSLEIDASPEACFETVTDYESFPSWQQAVKHIEVLSRNQEGLGELVEVHIDVKVREVSYRLRYQYERPHRVWWDFVSGDGVEHVDGEFRFEQNGGSTLATYELGIDPGVPLPGFVARKVNEQVMRRSVQDLADEVARRAAG